MKKKIKLAVLALVIIGLAFLYAHIDKNTYLYDRNAATEGYVSTGILKEGEQISQTFVCDEDVLDAINLKSSVVGSVENVILEYEVADNATGEKRTGEIAGTQIKNNKFNTFEYERISGAKGKSYTITLKETGSDESNGISFYIEPSAYQDAKLNVKGQDTQGALVVRTVSERFDFETFVVLLGFVTFVTVFMKVLYKLFR